MERSEQIGDLVTALAKAQGQFAAVERNGYNPHFESSYSTLDDIIAAVKEPLSKNGLAYMQFFGQDEGGQILTTMLTHQTGQFISTTARLAVSGRGSNELQRLGSTLTYMRRYMLAPLLGVNSEVDDDGNASGKKGGKESPPPQSEKAQAAQDEKRRMEAERQETKDKLIVRGQEVGLLSDPAKGKEWGPFYAVLGEVYEALRKTTEPLGGFGKLLPAGLALIEAAAPQPESETAEEVERATNLGAPLEDDGDALDDVYGHDLPPAE